MVRKANRGRQRGIDSEQGLIFRKSTGDIRIALVYPNVYSVGMSNLGFQTVYRLFNEMDGVVCERAFWPDPAEAHIRGIRTLESGRSLTDFSIIAFSVSFESDFLNLIAVVEKAGLPLQSAARGDPHPLVIAGGVACFLNPEPIAPFVDLFLIGEAEQLLPRFVAAWSHRENRLRQLQRMARTVPGVYVPGFYQPVYNGDETLRDLQPLADDLPAVIQKVREPDIAGHPSHTAILTPDTAFSNTFLVEVSRGCPHGCRFCSAGYIYRPPRFRPVRELQEQIEWGRTMSRKVGLMGAAVSDHPDIGALCRYALDQGLQVSFSSLRADAVTAEFADVLKKSGVKTATIAPEAGSERMRRIINKGIDEAHILDAVRKLVRGGIPNLKLYFMIGLPGETEGDIRSIITLSEKIKARFLEASREKKRIGTITVSVNPFVPKPFTPFQWAPMDPVATLNRKIRAIRDGLKKVANVRVQAESPRRALVQAVLSRGDRRIADLLMLALENRGNWSRTFKETDLDISFFAHRERDVAECLPWDFIDHGIRKAFLMREYQRAKTEQPSPDCPLKGCDRCGVCRI